MKILKRILFFIADICLIIACSKSDHFWGDEPLGNTMKGDNGKPIEVTVPFKTEFIYIYKSLNDEVPPCSAETPTRVIADGFGTATHLGKFTTHADFCVSMTAPGFEVPFTSFISTNGDELWLTTWCESADEPWNAPFLFIGGTGRFKGASGKGFYKGYNYPDDDSPVGLACHAIFEGTLIMVKGE
jgi:hypothetical protein